MHLLPLNIYVILYDYRVYVLVFHFCGFRVYFPPICYYFFYNSFYYFFFPYLSSLQLQTTQNPPKIRSFQNSQFPFTKAFEYEILVFPSKIPKTIGEREYEFFKNLNFPQKPRGIPKHSRF